MSSSENLRLDLDRFGGIDHLVLLRVRNGAKHTVAALPHTAESSVALRVLQGLGDRNGQVTSSRAERGGVWPGRLGLEPPGLQAGHFLPRLLAMARAGSEIHLEIVAHPQPGLFAQAASQDAAQASRARSALRQLVGWGDLRLLEPHFGGWALCEPLWAVLEVAEAVLPGETAAGDAGDGAPIAYLAEPARIPPGVAVGSGVWIGAGCDIGADAVIGAGTQLEAGVLLGEGSETLPLDPGAGQICILETGAAAGAGVRLTGVIGAGALVAPGLRLEPGSVIWDERTGAPVPPMQVWVLGGRASGNSLPIPHIPPYRHAVAVSSAVPGAAADAAASAGSAAVLTGEDLRDVPLRQGWLSHYGLAAKS